MAAALSSDAGAQAANLALRIGSNAADALSFAVELGEELPLISPVLKTLTGIREKVETVNSNREELKALEVRCSYITACVVVKCRQNSRSEMDVAPLTDCVKAIGEFVERCSRRGRVSRVLKASSDKDEIAGLNARVDRLTGDLGLAGIAVLEGKTDDVQAMLERMSKNQDIIVDHLQRPPVKLAKIPKGTPARKSWYVERRHVMESVFEALSGDCRHCLVGLVGGSGAGKTTAASEIVRSTEMLEVFSDGIVWLTVSDGAKKRLPALMMQLARMVHEDIGGRVGCAPSGSGDGAAYIKQYIEGGHSGKGFRCLVVADNVWEEEVVSKLLETGMSVLVSTRDKSLVTSADGEAVAVDELSEADAESVLRRAAELPPEVRLPDDAVDLIELCGRVAMDLAFVGRWSTVRGRQDRKAWSGAADKVRAEMTEVGYDPGHETAEDTRTKRRKAILRAGFEDLVVGTDDERVQRLYLSLAVLPDGHAFTVRDAATLLHGETPSSEDEASVGGVVGVLERWSVVRSTGRAYLMHDAHSSFARESLMDRGDVRRPALKRWVQYISSLDALRSIDVFIMKGLWLGVERVGGDGWDKIRPYAKALAELDESDPLLRESIEAVGLFQEVQEDWEGASITSRQLLEVEKRELGADHPFVLNTFLHLAECAKRLGNSEEAEEWRKKELEGLPLALARMRLQADTVELDQEFLRGVYVLNKRGTVGPEDRNAIEQLLRRCLAIEEASLGLENVTLARALCELGECVRVAGRLEEAEQLLRRCLVIEEAKLGTEGVQVDCRFQLGVCIREAGRLEEAETLLKRCLAIKEAKLGPKDVQVAHTLYQLGVCIREAGRLEEAEQLLRRCLAIREVKLGPEDVGLASTLHQLGVWLREAGRLEEAEELLRRCLAIGEAKLGREHVGVAYMLHHLGECVREIGLLEEAEELLRRCLAIEEAKLGPDDGPTAYTLYQLGVCIQAAGRLEEAEVLLRRCLAIREAKLGPEDSEVADTLYELSTCVRAAGRLEEAEKLLRRSLAIAEAKLGPEDVLVANVLDTLGSCVAEAGRLDEAEELLRRCLAIREAKVGAKGMQLASTLFQLGTCVQAVGRLDEAEQLLRRCLAVEEAELDPEDMRVAYTLHHLGKCVRAAGRLEEAEGFFRRYLAIREAKLGPDDVQAAYTLHELGVCVRGIGRLEEAAVLFRRSLTIKEATLGPEDVQVAYTLLSLGICLQTVGRADKAEVFFRRSLAIRKAKLGPQDGRVADALYHLGVCLRETGRPGEAEGFFRRCLAIQEETKCRLGQTACSVPVDCTLRELDVCVREAGSSAVESVTT